MVEKRHMVLWDGQCGFCRRSIEWLAKRDRQGAFEMVPFQQAPSPPMTPDLEEACKKAVHVVRTDGTVLKGARAILFVTREVGYRITSGFFLLPPMIWIAELVYKVIARNRMAASRYLFTKGRKT